MDQRKEEEDSLLKEPTDHGEEGSYEEPAGRRSEEEPAEPLKAAAAAEEEEEERSSDEESVSASTLFVHPCSLLQYLVRAFACCLGMQQPDSFAGTVTKPSATVAPSSLDSSRGGETPDRDRSAGGGATGFYVQEVITRVWALRRGPRPPGKPREGSGGNGGHHH